MAVLPSTKLGRVFSMENGNGKFLLFALPAPDRDKHSYRGHRQTGQECPTVNPFACADPFQSSLKLLPRRARQMFPFCQTEGYWSACLQSPW